VRSHAWIDQRSLALHEAIADKIEAEPRLVAVARANVARWLAPNRTTALLDWRDLLDVTPLSELLALLRSPAEEAARLRQSSPFAGLLTPQERQSILERYESRRS
jgi:hypothetical protein